jgi:hypothetical protein
MTRTSAHLDLRVHKLERSPGESQDSLPQYLQQMMMEDIRCTRRRLEAMNVYDICFAYRTKIDTSSNICRYMSSNTHICYSFPRAHWRSNSARVHLSISGASFPVVEEEAKQSFSISSLCWQRPSSWSGTLSSSSFLFLFRSFLFSFFLLFLLLFFSTRSCSFS